MRDKMEKNCSYKISWMMFAANIVIFFHHANLKDYYPEKATDFSVRFMDFFSAFAIPAMTWFFFMSAYLFFRNLDGNQIVEKWKKRAQTILVPYLLWNTAAVLLDVVKGDVRGSGPIDFIVTNYLFIDGSGCRNGPLWYMFRLMEFMLLAPIIYRIAKSKCATLISVAAVTSMNLIFDIGYFKFSYFLPVFIVGTYMGMNHSQQFENFISCNGAAYKVQSKKNVTLKTDDKTWNKRLKLLLSLILIIAFSYAVTLVSSLPATILRYLSVTSIFLLLRFVDAFEPVKLVSNGGGYVDILFTRVGISHCEDCVKSFRFWNAG